ncbi:MAG: hypothetical protein CMM23_00910 [Rhodospirillaceae bacterium]|jgi:hypothetical protein|nr:hypothetical protein [Rhodospirillaceae bacterium]|tara:strand:+ start:1348 stop:1689 length:342 start_codon:yes stop_codon:yes gene_type:complete
MIKHGSARTRFVITDAGIDQDGVARGMQNIGLDVQHDLVGFGLDIARIQPISVGLNHRLLSIRNKVPYGQERTFALDNTTDFKLTNIQHLNLLPLKACYHGPATRVIWSLQDK